MFSVPLCVKPTAPGGVSLRLRGAALALMLGASVACLPALAQTPAATEAPAGATATPTVSGDRIVRPTLRLGSQGESVRELQSMLRLLGYYPGPVTGLYQEDTATAARRFQTAAGITADGIVGPATWSRLFPTPPGEANPPTATTPTDVPTAPATTPGATAATPVLRPGMEGAAVRQLQQRLTSKGFYSGPIDGLFGSQTEAAVRRAQTASGLTVDGIVGPATWRALN
ncbi:MAG TPA: peptidoglycan-binding protein [Nodosilinea sp.]|nr:peptidoglycan-binding protein [Nodosilinea sp.]